MTQARFSDEAWTRNAALYEAIRTHPFNDELAAGTLDEAAFRQYVIQDAHYLVAFGRALAITAARADDPADVVWLAGASQGVIVEERKLHAEFFARFSISPQDYEATPLSPACQHYNAFLLATAYGTPYPVALAALLPCFWIYAEVGKDILSRAVSPNPYQPWIDTYSGVEFDEVVRGAIDVTDRAAARADARTRETMHRTYTDAARLEWMFWESACRREAWPV